MKLQVFFRRGSKPNRKPLSKRQNRPLQKLKPTNSIISATKSSWPASAKPNIERSTPGYQEKQSSQNTDRRDEQSDVPLAQQPNAETEVILTLQIAGEPVLIMTALLGGFELTQK